MKTIAAMILGLTALVAFSQNKPAPQSSGAAASYEARVTELESKIRTLEVRIRSLEIKEEQSRIVMATPGTPVEGGPKIYK
jgi:hypothetical protein